MKIFKIIHHLLPRHKTCMKRVWMVFCTGLECFKKSPSILMSLNVSVVIPNIVFSVVNPETVINRHERCMVAKVHAVHEQRSGMFTKSRSKYVHVYVSKSKEQLYVLI